MLQFFTCISLFLFSTDVFACSCAAFDLETAVKESESVYFGAVISANVIFPKSHDVRPYVEATLQIGEVFKGSFSSRTTTIKTGLGNGDCGISMIVPQTYIIFTSEGSDYIGACSGSAPLNYIVGFEDENELAEKLHAIRRNVPSNKQLKPAAR